MECERIAANADEAAQLGYIGEGNGDESGDESGDDGLGGEEADVADAQQRRPHLESIGNGQSAQQDEQVAGG